MKDFSVKSYVVDASVILKWFCKEKNYEQARNLLEDFSKEKIELSIPSLAYYEILNYISRNYFEDTTLFFSQLLMLKLYEVELNLAYVSQAMKIIKKFPTVSFYDAVYHAIAINNNDIFITADEKYYKRVRSIRHIQLLKNYISSTHG